MMFKEIRRIGVYVFSRVDDIEFVGVFDVLTRTKALKEELKEPLEVDIIASEEMIITEGGLTVKPHRVIEDFQDYDMVVIPGGNVGILMNDENFISKIKRFSENHMLGSICNGRRVLEKAGILGEKKTYREDPNLRVSVKGNILIAGRATCSIDLGLKILEMIYGERIADRIAYILDYSRET